MVTKAEIIAGLEAERQDVEGYRIAWREEKIKADAIRAYAAKHGHDCGSEVRQAELAARQTYKDRLDHYGQSILAAEEKWKDATDE